MTTGFDAVVDELYGLVPGEFVAARNDRAALANDAGDREGARRIRALPKPSLAAWAVSMLARHRAEQLAALFTVGERMRAAQDAHDGDLVRELGRERHRLITAAGATACELGDEFGVPVSASAAVEVQQTLQAAFGDPMAAAAVRSGTLVRTLTSNGLDPVDLDGATAVPLDALAPAVGPAGAAETTRGRSATDPAPAAVGADRAEADRGRSARETARREAEEARQDAEDAAAEVAGIELRMRDNTTLRDRLAEEVRTLKDELEAAQDELSATASARASLRKELTAATHASDAAERAAARARARLDRL